MSERKPRVENVLARIRTVLQLLAQQRSAVAKKVAQSGRESQTGQPLAFSKPDLCIELLCPAWPDVSYERYSRGVWLRQSRAVTDLNALLEKVAAELRTQCEHAQGEEFRRAVVMATALWSLLGEYLEAVYSGERGRSTEDLSRETVTRVCTEILDALERREKDLGVLSKEQDVVLLRRILAAQGKPVPWWLAPAEE